jgi:hypothetical protein
MKTVSASSYLEYFVLKARPFTDVEKYLYFHACGTSYMLFGNLDRAMSLAERSHVSLPQAFRKRVCHCKLITTNQSAQSIATDL